MIVTPLTGSLITNPRLTTVHKFYNIYLLREGDVYCTVVRARDGRESMWGRTELDEIKAFSNFRAVSEHIARERIGGDEHGTKPVGQSGAQAAVDV